MEEAATFMQPRDVVSSHTINSQNTDITTTELKNMEYEEISSDNVKRNETTEEITNWEDTCRVCANCRDHMIPIFENEGAEHNLSNKIHMYLPIQVSKTDSLPLKLCYHCAATLLAWHDLVTGCLDAENKLLQMQAETQQKDAIQLKHQQMANSNTLVVEIITPSEESVEDFQSIATQKLQNSNLPLTSHEIQDTEVIQLKYIEKSNLTELTEETVVVNELVDDPEPIATDILEISSAAQKETDSSLICEREESCATQELEQTNENVQQSSLGPETGERCRKESKCGRSATQEKCIKAEEGGLMKIQEESSKKRSKRTPEQQLEIAESRISKDGSTFYKCRDCEKLLSTAYNLLVHRKSHSHEKPHACLECGKHFGSFAILQRHNREVHLGRKDFQCDLCDRTLATKISRDEHRRAHTGEKPHVCDICGKSFTQKSSLYVHKLFHTSYLAYPCTECEMAFRRKQDLDKHVLIHTGERPYACELCNQRFRTSGILSRHRKTHSKLNSYVCEHCGSKFNQKRYLQFHISNIHGFRKKSPATSSSLRFK